MGALTHGDRRASESRDLSRFNIDNKYGRLALDATFKTIMGYEAPIVPPPADYQGEFFKGNYFQTQLNCSHHGFTNSLVCFYIVFLFTEKLFYLQQ